MIKTLSPEAQKVINDYLNLEIGGQKIICPYFINKGAKIRAGLKVLIGKGTPKEIKEEVKIIALREKINLENLSKENLKKFLTEHNIGIDCSGFVFHTLDAEFKATRKISLKKLIKFPLAKNPLRKLITKFRAVENIDVKTLAHPQNSREISLSEIMPGDLIILLGDGEKNNPDHILIIHKVEFENNAPKNIYYSHSNDDQNGSGIAQGKIEIIEMNKPLLNQKWFENETFARAKSASKLMLGRIK